MKKLIALAAVLSLGSLFADDGGVNTYGLLQVNSSDSRTIVAIPWIDASTTNGEIKVTDVVRTAELAPEDSIHYYNGTDYESWKLNDQTQWVAAVQSDISGSSQNGTSAADRALQRGNALILMRTNSTPRASFYLWGQVASTGVTNEISKGSSSLIAPPTVTQVGSDLGATWSGVNSNDWVYIDTATNAVACKLFVENNVQVWKKYVTTNTVIKGGRKITYKGYRPVENGDLAVGTGFWYKSAGSDDNVKVVWKDVPKVQ